MIDNTVHASRAPFDQFIPVRRLLHAHTRKLTQQSSGISVQDIFLFHQDLSPQTGTGQVKGHIGSVLRQDLLDALVCPCADDADIDRIALDGILLFFLFSFQESAEFILVKCLSRKLLILPYHRPDALFIKGDPRVLCHPRCVQHIDKFVRELFPEHIIKPSDAVAAGGQDHSFILTSHNFLQHPFCKTADIRMHPDLRLVKVGHIRLDPLHFQPHGLKNFHRSIFTYIT